jgi:hypothetical protein
VPRTQVYWTGWIAHHHRRRRGLLSSDPDRAGRRLLLGLALLGFTVRVWRPRRRGQKAAIRPERPPEEPAGVAPRPSAPGLGTI